MALLTPQDARNLELARRFLSDTRDLNGNPLAMMLQTVVDRIEELLHRAKELEAA